jgi:hypothetical protein
MFDVITPEELWKLKDHILERLNFVELLLDYGIEVSDESYNSFRYKSSCPLPGHYGNGENGEDRTPSFCISDKNTFYCFGCSSHGNALDFISKMEGTPIIEILRILGQKYGLIEGGSIKDTIKFTKERKKKNPVIDDIVHDTYILIRKYRKKHNDNDWVEKLSKVAESLFNKLEFQNWEKALSIKNKVIEKLEERGNK